MSVCTKKAMNFSLNQALLSEARELGVNLSEAAEEGLKEVVRKARAEAWLHENADEIASSNAWGEANGLPLERYRQF